MTHTKDNTKHLKRHIEKAYEDFRTLRRDRDNEDLWHSLSHHMRHAVYRSGKHVRRTTKSS